MSVEFIGMIHHKQGSEIRPAGPMVLDRGYIKDFAQAAEAGGFDRILIGYFADGADGFLVGALAAQYTERLGMLVAHRPGFISPPVAARKFATLDQITGGRVAMHVITGGEDAEMLRDGDVSTKEDRYARTDEYLDVLKKIWTDPAPNVDHQGRFYTIKGASTTLRCFQQPRIPIFFGGASEAAIAVAGKHADVYMLWGETHAQVRDITTRLRAEAAKHGRTMRFSLSFRPVLAPTEDEAWARAEGIKQRIIELRAKAGIVTKEPANEGSKRLLAAAAQGERLDKRLWTGAALATGARGNTTGLVGTPRQVAEVLVEYYDMGVDTFLVRGFDPLDDNIEYGRSLVPLTRQLIAEREGRRTAAE